MSETSLTKSQREREREFHFPKEKLKLQENMSNHCPRSQIIANRARPTSLAFSCLCVSIFLCLCFSLCLIQGLIL